MRQNLLTGLVDAASYNMARKQTQLSLYEQGRVYDRNQGTYNETEHLAALYSGNIYFQNWQHDDEPIDFYYVSYQLTNLFVAIGLDPSQIEYRPEEIVGMHPTRTAGLYLGDHYIGMIGMIAPMATMKDKSLNGAQLYGYELDLTEIIPLIINPKTVSKPAPKFPEVERDLSILVEKSVTDQAVEEIIKANGGKYLHSLRVIDVYQGSHIDSDKKSLTYGLTFMNELDTLTDKVVNQAIEAITTSLENKIDAKIR